MRHTFVLAFALFALSALAPANAQAFEPAALTLEAADVAAVVDLFPQALVSPFGDGGGADGGLSTTTIVTGSLLGLLGVGTLIGVAYGFTLANTTFMGGYLIFALVPLGIFGVLCVLGAIHMLTNTPFRCVLREEQDAAARKALADRSRPDEGHWLANVAAAPPLLTF